MDLTDLQGEIDNIIEEVENGSTIDTYEEAERIFAMCNKLHHNVSVSDIEKYCQTQLENSREFADSTKERNITYQKYMAKYFAYKDVKDWIKIHSR